MNEELLACLKELLYSVNNIEVLGEFSALDINRTSQKKMRAEIDATVAKCRAAISKAEGRT